MNNFISAFYDAVLLYAIALNETIQSGLDPRNGHNITSRMWGRTFVGITGNVSIDHNGDRYSDYSLLDLDPVQNRFVVSIFCKKLKKWWYKKFEKLEKKILDLLEKRNWNFFGTVKVDSFNMIIPIFESKINKENVCSIAK